MRSIQVEFAVGRVLAPNASRIHKARSLWWRPRQPAIVSMMPSMPNAVPKGLLRGRNSATMLNESP